MEQQKMMEKKQQIMLTLDMLKLESHTKASFQMTSKETSHMTLKWERGGLKSLPS